MDTYFLSVSHIEPRKNHLHLIRSFLHWKHQYDRKEKLVLLGDYRGNYFSYHEKVKELIEKHSNDIINISTLKSTDILFRSAYLGAQAHILLSSLETPGLSNIEGGLAGIPLILGDCLPVREYFSDFAYYVSPKHHDREQLFLYHPSKEILKKQQEFMKTQYSWESISQKLLTIYQSL